MYQAIWAQALLSHVQDLKQKNKITKTICRRVGGYWSIPIPPRAGYQIVWYPNFVRRVISTTAVVRSFATFTVKIIGAFVYYGSRTQRWQPAENSIFFFSIPLPKNKNTSLFLAPSKVSRTQRRKFQTGPSTVSGYCPTTRMTPPTKKNGKRLESQTQKG